MAQTFRALIISPNWVGDSVMAQVLVQGLRLQHPGSQIDVLSPSHCADVWRRAPGIREVYVESFQHKSLQLKMRWLWAGKLRGRYDQSVILPNSFKSALVPWLARIPLRTGYVGEMRYGLINDWRVLDQKKYSRWVDRCYALAFVDDIEPVTTPAPQLITHSQTQQMVLRRLNLEVTYPIVVLCPGAEFGSAKQWPLHHWKVLAERLLADGCRVWVMGGLKEREEGEWLQTQVPGVLSLCGQTSVGEAIDVLALADSVVANDSGLLHVAAALGKPVVGLYGSTTSHYAPPMARYPGQTQALEVDLSCRPCHQRICPLGHRQCLEAITPDQVYAAICMVQENYGKIHRHIMLT